jgi:CHASE2 domain-containing sensor protein
VADKADWATDRKGITHRTRLLLIAGSVFFSVALILPFWGESIEHAVSDAYFKWRGELSGQRDMVLVAIDDDSYQNLDAQWPWPRRRHADLLKSLSKAGARVIVFDILFDTKSKDPEDDERFLKAIKEHPKKVILAAAGSITVTKTYTKFSWLDPTPRLKSAKPSIGCVELLVDDDSVVRRTQPKWPNREGRLTLGYMAAKAFTGDNDDHWEAIANQNEALTINFLGPRGTIRTVSYYQALDPVKYLPENIFKDKLVFIGVISDISSHPTRPDQFPTPFSKRGRHMSGIEIHANVAYNLLHGIDIKQLSRSHVRAISLLFALMYGLLFFRLSPARGAVLLAATGGAGVLASYWIFAGARYYLALSWFLIPTGTLFFVSVFAHYYEGRLLLKQSEAHIQRILSSQPLREEIHGIEVFISYARTDANYMAEILDQIINLNNDGITFWSDRSLRPGQKWDEEIKKKLKEIDVALVLISQAYLDSEYCKETEIPAFIKRDVIIVPIMLSRCKWKLHDWLRDRQILPGEGKTLEGLYQDYEKRRIIFIAIQEALKEYADRSRAEDSR